MDKPAATVVITPREQFSKVRRSLESVLSSTDANVPLIYVDGNSPRGIAAYLKEKATRHGFTLLRTKYYLSANQARNLALPFVNTKYVAFVDNDAIVTEDWLPKLIQCAEETRAWVVGPLYLIDEPAKQIIHMAGAELRIVDEENAKRLHERHRFSNVPLAGVRDRLVRERTDLVEFHCMLVRTDVFDRLGPLDEELISFLDHVDFCLAVANAGGSVFIEPAVVVAHLAPPPYRWYDLPYFFLRFSDAWLQSSIRHFAQKHGLGLADAEFDGHRRFRNAHRLRLLGPVRGAVRKVGGHRGVALADTIFTNVICDRIVERAMVTRLDRQRLTASLNHRH